MFYNFTLPGVINEINAWLEPNSGRNKANVCTFNYSKWLKKKAA